MACNTSGCIALDVQMHVLQSDPRINISNKNGWKIGPDRKIKHKLKKSTVLVVPPPDRGWYVL